MYKRQAESRRDEALRLGLADAAYATIGEAVAAEHPDAALVCTAPLAHAAVIGELLDHDLPVFTELNLVSDSYRENMAKAAAKKLPLFLSSTMLYRRETQYIKQQVAEFGKPVHYIYHIGQYLPDLSLIHISEPTRLGMISYAVFCLKKKKKTKRHKPKHPHIHYKTQINYK